jgi:type I site-specific restriction endonuclease
MPTASSSPRACATTPASTWHAPYDSLDKFLQAWNDADRKAALIEELEAQGVLIEALADEGPHRLKDLDPFDLLLHVAYDQPPLTRRERANRVKKRNVFTQYGPVARQVIEALLDKYADEGITTWKRCRAAACSPSPAGLAGRADPQLRRPPAIP